MRLLFERQLACSPEEAFGLFSAPDQVNRWSFGVVRPLATGDGGHPGGVGALREVRFPGVPGRFQEVVEVAQPPGRFQSRYVPRGPIQTHRTSVHLTHGPQGTHLRFRVELELLYQAMHDVTRFRFEPGLRASLNKIVQVSKAAHPVPLPPLRRVDELVDLPALFEEATHTLHDQQDQVRELKHREDPLQWLAWVHAEATDLQVAACRAGVFQHPAWVLRLVPRFHRYHLFNMDRARRGRRTEAAWSAAFEAAREKGRLLDALELALRAHTEADLPRALAETYAASYRNQCDYYRFRGDFLAMGEVMQNVSERIFRTVEEHALPTGPRLARHVLPSRLFERAFGRRFRTLLSHRVHAFEEGHLLADSLTGATA